MESNEQFALEYRDLIDVLTPDDGSGWTAAKNYTRDTDFVNSRVWTEENVMFSAAGMDQVQLRFRCMADQNNDKIFIDDVTFVGM